MIGLANPVGGHAGQAGELGQYLCGGILVASEVRKDGQPAQREASEQGRPGHGRLEHGPATARIDSTSGARPLIRAMRAAMVVAMVYSVLGPGGTFAIDSKKRAL